MYKSTKGQADNTVPCQEIHGVPLAWKRKYKVESVHSVQYSMRTKAFIYIHVYILNTQNSFKLADLFPDTKNEYPGYKYNLISF